MADCKNCKYRQFLANAYDMHIDHNDCDKVNTFFCEKMQKPDTTVIIDAGCADKTMYHKGFKDGYESVHPWIPVSERLPDMSGEVLVCTKHFFYDTRNIAKAMFKKGSGGFYGQGGHWANVTHWMPLPEPPKGVV